MTSERPTIVGCTPSFKIADPRVAISHYVDWLGFRLDWQWPDNADAPEILHITRDSLSLFLGTDDEFVPKVTLRAYVSNLEALVDELNRKRPGAVDLIVEAPHAIPTASIGDPFGNKLVLQEVPDGTPSDS